MSTLVVEQPTLLGLDSEPTLDDVIAGVWRTLATHRSAECPVCHGVIEPVYAAHPLPVGGRCRGCRTALT